MVGLMNDLNFHFNDLTACCLGFSGGARSQAIRNVGHYILFVIFVFVKINNFYKTVMFSLFKKKDDNIEVPEWAKFFKKGEYPKFISFVKAYFEKKGMSITFNSNQIQVHDGILKGDKLGLINVAQKCHQAEGDEWIRIINDHFENLAKANAFSDNFDKHIDNFDYVRPYIGVSLYPQSYLITVKREVVIIKNITEEIIAMLVFDFPDAIKSIQPEDAIKWGYTQDQLFEIGINNIREKYTVEISQEKLGEFSIWFVQSNHFFTPNIIYNFKNNPKLIGSKGSLIGLPHRHSVLIYPIENLDTLKAINTLIPIINGISNEGPGTLSDKLYWYRDGEFMDLPYKLENKKLQFYPPESFVEILNTLAEV